MRWISHQLVKNGAALRKGLTVFPLHPLAIRRHYSRIVCVVRLGSNLNRSIDEVSTLRSHSTMASERVQRQIDRLLDDDVHEWEHGKLACRRRAHGHSCVHNLLGSARRL